MAEFAITENFPMVWDYIENVVREHGGYNKNDIYALLQSGELQAHAYSDDAAFVTEIREYPRKRVLFILFGGGSGVDEWKDKARQYFATYGLANGCVEMQVLGRFGWIRKYPEAKTPWSILRIELDGRK